MRDINKIIEDKKKEEKVKEPRRKNTYCNSKAEQKFNNYCKQFQGLTITKRGFPDFMLINKKNECLGFVEVKSNSFKKLRFE